MAKSLEEMKAEFADRGGKVHLVAAGEGSASAHTERRTASQIEHDAENRMQRVREEHGYYRS